MFNPKCNGNLNVARCLLVRVEGWEEDLRKKQLNSIFVLNSFSIKKNLKCLQINLSFAANVNNIMYILYVILNNVTLNIFYDFG